MDFVYFDFLDPPKHRTARLRTTHGRRCPWRPMARPSSLAGLLDDNDGRR